MSKKVSIIVPVYHVEEYLSQCVDSLVNQTYRNIEIVLVDDGGDDGCPARCDQYTEADPRVVCVHKQNEGQSFARRDGLAVSTGDYVMFVDSDDWLESDAVAACVQRAEETGADVVMFGYQRIYQGRVFPTSLFSGDREFDEKDTAGLQRRMVGLYGQELAAPEAADRLSPMWGKLYARKVALAGGWYSEREVGSSEDALFNLHAFSVCKKCVYLDRHFYCYRKTNSGSTTTKYRMKLVEQWRVLFRYFERYIQDNGLDETYCGTLKNRIACSALGIGLNELESPEGFLGKAKRLRKVLSDPLWREAYSELEFRYFPFKWKVFFFLCEYRQTELLLVMLKMIWVLKSKVAS